jgi:outer membrane protein assembly factor BamB
MQGKVDGSRRLGKGWAVAALLLPVLLAGCSSLNPFAKKAPPRNPPAPLIQFNQTLSVRTLWSASTGSVRDTALQPAVAGKTIYAATADGKLSRFDAASGNQVWQVQTGSRLTAGVGTDGVTVAVGARDGNLLAYDDAGKLRWKVQLPSEILSAPAVGEGLVVVRSLDNRISAYEVGTGRQRWTLRRNAPPLTLRSAPGIVIGVDAVYVGLPGGRLLSMALTNGGPRWEAAVGEPRGATELERIADISGMPVLLGREICAVAYQGRVACMETGTGQVRWVRPFSSTVGLGIDERFVFGVDDKSVVNAWTRDTGNSVWRNTNLQNRDLSAPVSMGRAVAVGDREGFVHFLSREDGSLLARQSSDGSPITGMALVGDSLLVQTQAGRLMLLGTQNP